MGILERLFSYSIDEFIIRALAIIGALVLHEFAHGLVALRLGDTTARDMGRLSLNPLKHIDPIGALFLLIVGYGWAKPVPVDANRFQRNRDKGMALVGAAGPLANLIQAIFGGILLFLLNALVLEGNLTFAGGAHTFSYYLFLFLIYYIQINVVLMVFNLLPLPPLDGSRIVAGFLNPEARFRYYRIEPFGLIIIMLLCITSIMGMILTPPVTAICNLIYSLAGIV